MSTGLKLNDVYVTVTETVSYRIKLSELIRPDVLLNGVGSDPYELESVLEDAWLNLRDAQPYCEGTDERTIRVYAEGHGCRELDGDDLIPILEAATDYKTQDDGGVV